jgi:hypothetical protein
MSVVDLWVAAAAESVQGQLHRWTARLSCWRKISAQKTVEPIRTGDAALPPCFAIREYCDRVFAELEPRARVIETRATGIGQRIAR